MCQQKSTSHLSEKCEVRPAPGKGRGGVFARECLKPGQLIGLWSGQIVSREGLALLPEGLRRHTVQVEEDLFLASLSEDEPADFINHSCDPNAGVSGQIAIVARRMIVPGEEITLDYAMCDSTPYDEFACACGTRLCRGQVTGEDWCNPELWARYGSHFSTYLLRRISALKRRIRRQAELAGNEIGTPAAGALHIRQRMHMSGNTADQATRAVPARGGKMQLARPAKVMI